MASRTQDAEAADAAASLGLVRATRAHLADLLVTPWWYHPALGSVLGAFLLIQAVEPRATRYLFIVVWGFALEAVRRAYRRHTGVYRSALWMHGFPRGSARREAIAMLCVLCTLFLGAAALEGAAGRGEAPVIAGVLTLPCVVVLGRRLDRALREDLRTELGTDPGRRS